MGISLDKEGCHIPPILRIQSTNKEHSKYISTAQHENTRASWCGNLEGFKCSLKTNKRGEKNNFSDFSINISHFESAPIHNGIIEIIAVTIVGLVNSY